MKVLSEKQLNILSTSISVIFHLLLLFIVFPYKSIHIPHVDHYKIPVEMLLTEEIEKPKPTPPPKPQPIPQEKVAPPPKKDIKPIPKIENTETKVPIAEVIPTPSPIIVETPSSNIIPTMAEVIATPSRLPGDRDLPQVRQYVAPVYPKSALNLELTGNVVAEFTINEDGIVIGHKVIKSSGHDILDKSFVQTVTQYYSFDPKRVLGENKEGSITLDYTYEL